MQLMFLLHKWFDIRTKAKGYETINYCVSLTKLGCTSTHGILMQKIITLKINRWRGGETLASSTFQTVSEAAEVRKLKSELNSM
jgi:hypothetical protein